MMSYSTRQPGLTGVRGTHYNALPDHFFYATDSGEVYLLPTIPAMLLVQKSQIWTKNTSLNLNSTGGTDIKWTTLNQLLAQGNSKLLALTGYSSLDSIPVSALVDANWGAVTSGNSIGETGSDPVGHFYAVQIPTSAPGVFHYAKLRIYKSGSLTKVDWATYNISPDPVLVGAGYGDVRDLVVSENETALYFTSNGGAPQNGYVYQSPRTPDLNVAYPKFGVGGVPLHSMPLDDVQQMEMDGGFVYAVDATKLWRINLSTGDQEVLVDGLSGGVGLLLSVDGALLKAYIADAQGKIFVVDLSDFNGFPIPLPAFTYQIDGPCGFMNWANPEHTAFFVTQRKDDKRAVLRVDVKTGVLSTEGATTAAGQIPWSVELISDNQLFVSCETEIGQFARSIVVSDILPLGIGLIPFDYITNSIANPSSPALNDGKADTSVSTAPSNYYFSAYPNLPFAGRLSLMINHPKAWNSGIRYYSIKLRNPATNSSRTITTPYGDFKWDETLPSPKFMGVTTTPANGLFPVRDPDELWYNPFLGGWVQTAFEDNGHNVLSIDFFDGDKNPVTSGHFDRLIYIDNTRCNAVLELPRIGTNLTPPAAGDYPSLVCGCLAYDKKDDLLEIDFKAWQPQGTGSYTLSFSRGVAGLGQSGTVTPDPVLVTKKTVAPSKPIRAGHILGDCDVANVVITLSVPSKVIDGFGWVNLGVSTYRSFTLIKGPVTHTPWTSPE